MRSILPKGDNRKRHSIAARAITCVLVALLALPFAGCSASPNATGGTARSQEYTVSVSLSGGSGRASIASPTTIVKDGDTYNATITWSSSNYDKMTVDGVDYAPVNDGGNSTFEIPVTLDEDIAVSAETVAMSTPHTIDYTINFDSSTMKEKSGDDASGGSPAGTASSAAADFHNADLGCGWEPTGALQLEYAEHFTVDEFEGGLRLICVSNGERFLVVPQDAKVPDGLSSDIAVIRRPADKVYLVSSATMCLVDALDANDNIIMSGTKADDCSVAGFKSALESGAIAYGGKYSAPDYERISASGCTLAIENTMINHTPDVKEKLQKLGLVVLTEQSSSEPKALGRVEWIKLFGVLFDKEDEATHLFNEQKARWEAEKNSVEEVKSLKADIDHLHAQIEEAQRNYEYEKAARLQYSDLPSLEKKLSEAEAAAERRKSDNSLVHDTVTEEEIAGIVAKWTGIPVAKLMEGEREKLLHLDEVLHRRLIGQDEAVEKVCEAIQRSRAGISDPNRPIGSFLFLGPTGVGKTELAKALAESLFDDERSMVRIDMTEYMEKFSVSRLIGAPPGYVGYDEGGQLTEAVRRKPYSVVLFDEVEKAHPDVFNILLQILDDGRITDSQGRTVDFKNTIIILTSNLGSQYLLDGIGPDGEITADAREHVQAELRRAFRPEFLNRLDEILMFRPLTRDNLSHIIDNLIAALRSRLADRTLNLEMTDAAKALVIENGYDPVYGARPLKRYLQSHAETLIARTILSGDLHAGDTLVVDADNGALVCRVKA